MGDEWKWAVAFLAFMTVLGVAGIASETAIKLAKINAGAQPALDAGVP